MPDANPQLQANIDKQLNCWHAQLRFHTTAGVQLLLRQSQAPTSVTNGIQLATWLLLHLLMCILNCNA